MSGSRALPAPHPHPLSILIRVAVVGTLVLALAYAGRLALVAPLLPSIAVVVPWMDDEFRILSVDTAQDGSSESVRIKANLARPIYVGAQVVYPLGSHGQPQGWYQVDLALAGIFIYCVVLLIIVLAWPASRSVEYFARLAVTVPLMGLLLFLDVPFTVLAQLWFPLHSHYQPAAFWPLLAWSRFLMGGGGFVIAAAMALIAIRIGAVVGQR
jgi:hypothetical protein